MWACYVAELSEGRMLTGAELDRIAGTRRGVQAHASLVRQPIVPLV